MMLSDKYFKTWIRLVSGALVITFVFFLLSGLNFKFNHALAEAPIIVIETPSQFLWVQIDGEK